MNHGGQILWPGSDTDDSELRGEHSILPGWNSKKTESTAIVNIFGGNSYSFFFDRMANSMISVNLRNPFLGTSFPFPAYHISAS